MPRPFAVMGPLESYLQALHQDRSFGEAQDETSFYGHLQALLNDVGKRLKPKVRCILHPKNRGAGFPDGGLFSAEQRFKGETFADIGQLPASGAIEVKPVADDAWVTARTPQVRKYQQLYDQVLVTNYRDFMLVGRESGGKLTLLDRVYRLAESEKEFWEACRHSRKTAEEHEAGFSVFLRRVLLHEARIKNPKQLAGILAEHAREALIRIEGGNADALEDLRKALEEALGTKFVGEKGEHFFRSTLVQTLFYGLFSAWVLWQHTPAPRDPEKFTWHGAHYHMGVPFISALFQQLESPTLLRPIGLEQIMDWATAALNRVEPGEFFKDFEDEQAVQYFYEPFLEAFDPQLRKDYGVWYTPKEIVQYMVERVDRVLRTELGLADGLADKNVVVLDPCCGTGAFLVEVLNRIHKTLEAKGADALTLGDVKRAARERVFGFEIMPAPFVVAHLQIGLRLERLGVPLDEDKSERAAVYLTNALTGWEPPKGGKQHLMFAEMEAERDAAEQVKRDKRILVVLGNPPYNAFAGTSPDEEQNLVKPYKDDLVKVWKIKKFNLDDLYVRFFRLAERRIAEMTKKGVVCFISNFSYLGDPSFVQMRKRFVDEFDALWLDCLNGDSRETGKLTPDGKPDPSVFSTDSNPEGIRVGTAIGLLVKHETAADEPAVHFRNFWGTTKRADLLANLNTPDFDASYERAKPTKENRYSFRPGTSTGAYNRWPQLSQLSANQPLQGLDEDRMLDLIAIDAERLRTRMKLYFDPDARQQELLMELPGLMRNSARFDALSARKRVLEEERFDDARVVRYFFKPFDYRHCYYTAVRPIWKEPRPTLWAHFQQAVTFVISRPNATAVPEGPPFFLSKALIGRDSIRGHAVAFPFELAVPWDSRGGNRQLQIKALGDEDSSDNALMPNLSPEAHQYFAGLQLADVDGSTERTSLLWPHILAVGYSPAYLSENADGIRQDWPRIPLPDSKEALECSAALGQQIANLLDVDRPVPGVSTDPVRAELRAMGNIDTVDGKPIGEGEDLAVTAGWGHAGKDNATMPGKGKRTERECTAVEREAIESGAKALGISANEVFARLGETTHDVYLNGNAFWRNIPAGVWDYYIGGYQVIKKWLSYRERDLLGRPLKADEARYVTEMMRRIAAIVLMGPELDANYLDIKEHTYPWPKAE